jgi:hypothetical protein
MKYQMLARTGSHRSSHWLLVGVPDGTAFWKTIWQFLPKLNIVLPHDPTTMLLGIYSTDLKTSKCVCV